MNTNHAETVRDTVLPPRLARPKSKPGELGRAVADFLKAAIDEAEALVRLKPGRLPYRVTVNSTLASEAEREQFVDNLNWLVKYKVRNPCYGLRFVGGTVAGGIDEHVDSRLRLIGEPIVVEFDEKGLKRLQELYRRVAKVPQDINEANFPRFPPSAICHEEVMQIFNKLAKSLHQLHFDKLESRGPKEKNKPYFARMDCTNERAGEVICDVLNAARNYGYEAYVRHLCKQYYEITPEEEREEMLTSLKEDLGRLKITCGKKQSRFREDGEEVAYEIVFEHPDRAGLREAEDKLCHVIRLPEVRKKLEEEFGEKLLAAVKGDGFASRLRKETQMAREAYR